MSLYPNKIQVDGVPCGLILRGSANGTYLAVFEREMAELARIEQIDWSRPAVVGESPLPAGYGFQVRDIRYAHATRSYTVLLQTAEQYLGDVAGFQAQLGELAASLPTQQYEENARQFLLFYLLGILSAACGGVIAWHLSRRQPATERF